MNKCIKRIIFACFTTIAMMSTSLTANASVTYVIDNDPTTSSGYSHSPGNFQYQKDTKYYNGDARYSTNANDKYYWNFKWTNNQYSGINVKWRVYLNSSNFTNDYATYYLNTNGITAGVAPKLGTIKQNRAPAGWGNYNTTYFSSNILVATNAYKGFMCQYVYLSTNGYSGTGADGIELIFPS